jgi:hypothetical protein
MMRKVLLVVNNDAFGPQMARWAHLIKRTNSWEPVIYITADYMNRHLTSSRNEGIKIIAYEPPSPVSHGSTKGSSAQIIPLRRQLEQKIAKALGRFLPLVKFFYSIIIFCLFPFMVISRIKELKHQIRFARKVIRDQEIDAVLIDDSGPPHGGPVYIHADPP